MFELTDYSRSEDLYPKQYTPSTSSYYPESESAEILEYTNEDGEIEYYDPNYQYAQPFNSPFQNVQSFNPYNPYSSSMWLSPSIAYWNRNVSYGMGMGVGFGNMGMGTMGMGMGMGMHPHHNAWHNPAWNPYASGLYNPWYYQPGFGFMGPSLYNPYYNQFMMPWGGGETNRSPVYYQKRNNVNRQNPNAVYTPGRNVVPLQNTKKRQAVPRNNASQPMPSPNNNAVRMPSNTTSPAVSPSNRGTSPNKVNRYQSPNRSASPSRGTSVPSARPSSMPSFSSPSPAPRSAPSRSSSPNRR